MTVLDQKEIENLNLNNVGEVVAQLPSNSNFFAANNVGLGNFNVGAQLVNLRGLNPFFGTRTLTLIDTKRVVPTTTGGGVDVTLIPSMLVARTETVTGGASAVYGSDAIAGVVNIILDTKLDGLKGQADFSRDLARRRQATITPRSAYGTGFADGRGHIVIGGEYEKTRCDRHLLGRARLVRPRTTACSPTRLTATQRRSRTTSSARTPLADTSLTGVLVPCTSVPGRRLHQRPGTARGAVQRSRQRRSFRMIAGSYCVRRRHLRLPRRAATSTRSGAYDATTMRPSVKQ